MKQVFRLFQIFLLQGLLMTPVWASGEDIRTVLANPDVQEIIQEVEGSGDFGRLVGVQFFFDYKDFNSEGLEYMLLFSGHEQRCIVYVKLSDDLGHLVGAFPEKSAETLAICQEDYEHY